MGEAAANPLAVINRMMPPNPTAGLDWKPFLKLVVMPKMHVIIVTNAEAMRDHEGRTQLRERNGQGDEIWADVPEGAKVVGPGEQLKREDLDLALVVSLGAADLKGMVDAKGQHRGVAMDTNAVLARFDLADHTATAQQALGYGVIG